MRVIAKYCFFLFVYWMSKTRAYYGSFERVFKNNHRCHQGDKFYETNRWHYNNTLLLVWLSAGLRLIIHWNLILSLDVSYYSDHKIYLILEYKILNANEMQSEYDVFSKMNVKGTSRMAMVV